MSCCRICRISRRGGLSLHSKRLSRSLEDFLSSIPDQFDNELEQSDYLFEHSVCISSKMESDRARNAICRLARSHVVDVPSSSRLRAGCDLIRVMLPASHSR